MPNSTPIQDAKKHLIVQHNDLITARYDLDIDAFRVLILILSKVNQRKSNPGWVTITAHEYQKTFSINRKNTARCFKNAVDSLWNGSINFYVITDKTESLVVMRWITTHKFEKSPTEAIKLMIKLNPDLDNFLFNIRNNFSSFFLKAIQSVRTVSAFRLYMLLFSLKNHPKYKRKGFFEVDFSFDNLRELFPNASNRTSDFIRRTIDPSVQDINRNSNLSIYYQVIRQGRHAVALRFGCVEETVSISKPIRPRLAKRPHVNTGSQAEGEWMQNNAERLYEYEKALQEYDPALRLNIQDLRRAVEYARLFKPAWYHEKLEELSLREVKAKKRTAIEKPTEHSAHIQDARMELDFGKKGEERIREMRGHNVIELGEIRGMNKRGIGDVRVTISTRADRNRGLFREYYVTLPRRCGFIGTSNRETPLTPVSIKLTLCFNKNKISSLLIHGVRKMAHVVVKKWGNSPSVRLPVAIMQAASLNVDDTVDIAVENGRIVIVPIKAKEYSLETLLAGITSENIHERTDFGKPVGKELL